MGPLEKVCSTKKSQIKCDDEVPLVWFVILCVADERLHLVVDAARLARVARSRLQGDACRAMGGKLEVEWMRILAQLLDETLLQNISMLRKQCHLLISGQGIGDLDIP